MLGFKTIDKLLIKSFFPPFVMSFFVSLFVLIMQFLWKYIDDIVGKGLDVWVILELMMYLVMTLVTMATPIAVLIASVMVLGNLAERYELSSLKSAGIPLVRVMQPLAFIGVILMIISFLFSNYIVPYSNLQFHSRLYDIRRQRPALSLEKGVFNEDFKNIVIRVGDKDETGNQLKDVMIYDHTPNRRDENHQIVAKQGAMEITPDERFLILTLKDGKHYQDIRNNTEKGGKYPFVRTSFGTYEKIFDMQEFDLDRTDQSLFKTHQRMLSVRQLVQALDSINIRETQNYDAVIRNARGYFYYLRMQELDGKPYQSLNQEYIKSVPKAKKNFEEWLPPAELAAARQRAENMAIRVQEYVRSASLSSEAGKESKVAHLLELHRKFTFAFACLLFLFIGAPMGAIVRKGGFGFPILVAIVFFMLFIVLSIIGEKLAKEMVVPAEIGSWMACLTLMPLGFWLTFLAMNDVKAFSSIRLPIWLKNIGKFLSKKLFNTQKN